MVRLLTWATVGALLLYQLAAQNYALEDLRRDVRSADLLCLIAAVLLLPLNLGLEAYKWRRLLLPFYPQLTLAAALRGVLAGCALGFFTPGRVGDYFGRLLSLPEGSRRQAGALTFIDRLAQMMITLFIGCAALWGFALSGLLPAMMVALLPPLTLTCCGCALMLTQPKLTSALFRPVLKRRWFARHALLMNLADGLEALTRRALWRALSLSAGRYAVFTSQYLLLMYAFGLTLSPLTAAGLAAVVFLMKSFLPTAVVAELGVRESIALYVFGWAGVGASVAFNATLALFVLNLLLPAVLGFFTLPRLFWKSS